MVDTLYTSTGLAMYFEEYVKEATNFISLSATEC
jgi:hypothetical protein